MAIVRTLVLSKLTSMYILVSSLLPPPEPYFLADFFKNYKSLALKELINCVVVLLCIFY